MKPSEIKKILKAAQEMGVTRIKLGDFEAEFPGMGAGPSRSSPLPSAGFPTAPAPLLKEGELSYEEMLLMSTPSFDQMQEDKAAQDEQPE